METLRLEVKVGAPIEDVWHAWTDTDTKDTKNGKIKNFVCLYVQ